MMDSVFTAESAEGKFRFQDNIVTAQYLGAMIMDSRLRGNDEIGQPPVIPEEAGIQ